MRLLIDRLICILSKSNTAKGINVEYLFTYYANNCEFLNKLFLYSRKLTIKNK